VSALDPRSIGPDSKVGEILKEHPEVEEALIRLSPEFRRLRNPVLRATVAKVATLRHVAAVGGVPVAELVEALRAAVAAAGGAGGTGAAGGTEPAGADPSGKGAAADASQPAGDCPSPSGTVGDSALGSARPAWFDPARIARTYDARPAIEEGRHPLPDVLQAARELPEGAILELVAPFEPAPLVDVMRGKGYEAWGERRGRADVRVYFHRV